MSRRHRTVTQAVLRGILLLLFERRVVSARKNAILLFSKPPISGLVKTRLTTLKDGVFTPEVAAGLFHCMLFDVVEICCDACAELESREESVDTYDIIISTTPVENVQVMKDLFRESGVWPRPIQVIADVGASFDEHYNNAFEQVWNQGYDSILSMGADMPALPRGVVVKGFELLHQLDEIPGGGIVISPDQEMGVSIIGWTRDTKFDHSGVFYNPDGWTVLPAYIHKAQKLGLPALYLDAVPDVDTMLDLMHNITLVQAVEYCAQYQDLSVAWRTIQALHEIGFDEVRVPPNDLHDPRESIDIE